ncbi:MAG: VCBS repeat-containing protein [Cyclobacteriaceae bacterium]|nr:VCBS repeat-containing protein [Cyclobacteriaceae bacterium]
MRRYLYLLLLILPVAGYAQTPVINSVTPIATYAGDALLITGSGFSTNPAQLKVLFDHVAGTIISSSALSIEVTVPPQARLANVEVINLVSGLSGKSLLKVVPTYNGEDFVATAISSPLSFANPEEVFDLCSCDMDGDNKPDLAGSKQGLATNIMLLRNTSTVGSLSFASSTVGVTAPTFNLACGDLDGDGKPDLLASRGGATRNEVFVLRNTSTVGSISFSSLAPLLLETGHLAFRVAIRDLNADGKPEVIVTNAFDDLASADNIVYVFPNQSTVGSISFAAPVKVTVTASNTSYGLDVQDIDGDRKPDIIINPFTASNIYILRNTSAGTISFAASQQINLGANLIEITTADFNEDGKLDLAATSSFDDRAVVFLNQSTPGAISFASVINLTTGDLPWGINATDADGDGDVDILVGTRGAATTGMTLFKSNGVNNALAFTPVTLVTNKKSRNVRVGDFDGDAKPDFAYTADTGNSLDIVRNQNCYVPFIENTTPLSICAGQTIRLTTIPGIGVTNYNWKESGVTVSSTTNPFLDITAAGTYTVTATSEGGSCVKNSNTVVVTSGSGTIPSDPVISSNSPLCATPGSNLALFGPTVAGATYHWTGPNGFTSAAEDPIITNATAVNAGIYSLQLSNGTCFSNVVTTRVDIADFGSFSVGTSLPSNTICQGSNLTLSVNAQSGHTYQWRKDGVDIGGQTGTSLIVTQEGAYTVRVTNTLLSCSIITSPAVTVTVYTLPVANFTVNATACIDEVLSFTDQSSKDSRATLVYDWNFGDAGTSSAASPTHAYTTASSFNPSLTLSYSGVSGCTSNVTKPVTVTAAPTVTIDPAAPTIASGASVQLMATGATSYAWSPPDGLSSTSVDNPVANPVITTTYTVVGTQGTCTGTATVTVTVSGSTGTMSIPNVFTPNGDGANDQLIIQTTDGQCTVSVFDPAGRKVFEEQGSPIIWDGNYSGSPAPAGTYFYVVTCPTSGTVSGHFLLAR